MSITVEIPDDVEKQIQQSVVSGDIEGARHLFLNAVFPTVEARIMNTAKTEDDLLGLFADEPELIDRIVSDAMTARETHPLRTPGG